MGYYSTSGLKGVTDSLKRRRSLTPEIIREQMSGNICRCGTYAEVLAAVKSLSEKTATLTTPLAASHR